MTWTMLSGEVLAGSSCSIGLREPLSVSQHSCWIGSRSELQTEKSGLYGAEGWDVMGLEGWSSCTLASPCEYWDDDRLSPKHRIASLPLFCYLFILGFIPLLPPPQVFWIMGKIRHLNVPQPDSKSCAHNPAPGLAVQAAPVLPSHLPRPFCMHSAFTAVWAKGGNSVTAQG